MWARLAQILLRNGRGDGLDPELRRMRWPSTVCELEALPVPHFAV